MFARWLPCTLLSKHFSAVHSVVVFLSRVTDTSVFYLNIKAPKCITTYRGAEATLLLIKLSKTTSPQRWRFYFALKQNEKKQTEAPRKKRKRDYLS